MTVQKQIASYMRTLAEKAAKNGLYENFGDKEVRKLRDRSDVDPFGTDEQRNNSALVSEFERWCMNYC